MTIALPCRSVPCPYLSDYDRMCLCNGMFVYSSGVHPGEVFISDWKAERFVVICVSEQRGMSSLRRLTPDETMEVMTRRRD